MTGDAPQEASSVEAQVQAKRKAAEDEADEASVEQSGGGKRQKTVDGEQGVDGGTAGEGGDDKLLGATDVEQEVDAGGGTAVEGGDGGVKKRKSEIQMTKMSYEEGRDEDDYPVDPAAMVASKEQMAGRRIVKGRRRGGAAPASGAEEAAPSTVNPFQGFSLTGAATTGPSQEGKDGEAAAAAAPAPEAANPEASQPSAQGGFALPTFKFGSGDGGLKFGFGGVAGLGAGGGFGSVTGATATFGAGAAFSFGGAAIQAADEEGKQNGADGVVANGAGTSNGAEEADVSHSLPPQDMKRLQGEEGWDTLFSGTCALYQMVEKAWKERGRGDLRVLTKSPEAGASAGGATRLVMRKSGNQNLLLNATIYRGIKLQRQGPSSVLFQVANTVPPGFDTAEEGAPKLQPFAVRSKDPTFAAEFMKVVEEAAGQLAAAPQGTEAGEDAANGEGEAAKAE